MMSTTILIGADSDVVRPEYALAALMQTEMQVPEKIDPVALRLFLLAHWDEVSRLAHKIHESRRTTKIEFIHG